MGHSYPLREKRAAVKVERIDGRSHKFRVVPGSMFMLKPGTMVMECPEAHLFNGQGDEITPSGRFLRTAETIDPYHIVTDMF